eukprot:357812_1
MTRTVMTAMEMAVEVARTESLSICMSEYTAMMGGPCTPHTPPMIPLRMPAAQQMATKERRDPLYANVSGVLVSSSQEWNDCCCFCFVSGGVVGGGNVDSSVDFSSSTTGDDDVRSGSALGG